MYDGVSPSQKHTTIINSRAFSFVFDHGVTTLIRVTTTSYYDLNGHPWVKKKKKNETKKFKSNC